MHIPPWGECSETSQDAIGGSDWDGSMRRHPHVQERAKALIKSGVQMMRWSVWGQDGIHIAKFDNWGAAKYYPIFEAGPSRTKDRDCSRTVWFCSMITRIHKVSRVTQIELEKLEWEALDHPPYSPDMSDGPAISMCLVHWRNTWKGSTSFWMTYLRTLWRTGPRHSHRNSRNKESCIFFISGIVVLKPMVNILNKIYICTNHVVLYLFIWSSLVYLCIIIIW